MSDKIFVAGTCSRVAAALFFDAISNLILKYYTPFSYIWVIVECLKGSCEPKGVL